MIKKSDYENVKHAVLSCAEELVKEHTTSKTQEEMAV